MKAFSLGSLILFSLLLACDSKKTNSYSSDYYPPSTVSPQARDAITSFKFKERNYWPEADEFERWRDYWEYNEKAWSSFNDSIVRYF